MVSIFINNNAPRSHIPLNTNLQAVAVSITLHRVITLCSIYIPPSSRLSPKDLDDLIPQLPSPFILLNDINGHNILWGSKDINDKCRIIESFIDNHGLCLYNTKTPTYLHPATGTYTSLDLSICFPTLLLDFDWKVHDDLCGSDHFPIGGGAKVLDKLPVPGRPTNLAYRNAFSVGAGGGCLDIFSLIHPFSPLSPLPLFGRRPDID